MIDKSLEMRFVIFPISAAFKQYDVSFETFMNKRIDNAALILDVKTLTFTWAPCLKDYPKYNIILIIAE